MPPRASSMVEVVVLFVVPESAVYVRSSRTSCACAVPLRPVLAFHAVRVAEVKFVLVYVTLFSQA